MKRFYWPKTTWIVSVWGRLIQTSPAEISFQTFRLQFFLHAVKPQTKALSAHSSFHLSTRCDHFNHKTFLASQIVRLESLEERTGRNLKPNSVSASVKQNYVYLQPLISGCVSLWVGTSSTNWFFLLRLLDFYLLRPEVMKESENPEKSIINVLQKCVLSGFTSC